MLLITRQNDYSKIKYNLMIIRFLSVKKIQNKANKDKYEMWKTFHTARYDFKVFKWPFLE